MKKKVTQQKKVPTLDLHQSFDLGNVTLEARVQYAQYLKDLTASAGWKLMKQILEGNLSIIEKTIVTKVDVVRGVTLEEKELDELRVQHAQITQLLEKPFDLIKQFEGEERRPVTSDYDPYSHGFMSDKSREGSRSLTDTI